MKSLARALPTFFFVEKQNPPKGRTLFVSRGNTRDCAAVTNFIEHMEWRLGAGYENRPSTKAILGAGLRFVAKISGEILDQPGKLAPVFSESERTFG